jgi:hypothetical protein
MIIASLIVIAYGEADVVCDVNNKVSCAHIIVLYRGLEELRFVNGTVELNS